jgi:hypothetical protein
MYHRDDLLLINTSRWVPATFSFVEQVPDSASPARLSACGNPWSTTRRTQLPPPATKTELLISHVPVPVERVVLFTYQDGQSAVIESLTLTEADGTSRVVVFPLAREIERHGNPTIETLAVPSVPVE